METTYIENAQYLTLLRPPRSDTFHGRTRKALPQITVALCPSSNCGHNVTRDSSMTRHCWQKKKSDINTLSGIFDFKAKVAEMIHLPPLGRNIQHVARPGTQSGQLHE